MSKIIGLVLIINILLFDASTVEYPVEGIQNGSFIFHANPYSGSKRKESDDEFTSDIEYPVNPDLCKKNNDLSGHNGITFTTGELKIWRERAAKGPYRKWGDRFANSPGTYMETKARADFFRNNPGTDYVTDDPRITGVDGYGEYLLSAAWHYLLGKDTTYGNAVHDHIVAQVQEEKLDYSGYTNLATGGENVTFGAALVNKIFFAYDYTRDMYSEEEKTLIEDWVYNAARFYQKSANERTLGLAMKFRSDNGKYATIAAMLADQRNQIVSHYYWVEDTNLNYEFKGSASGDIKDYIVQTAAKRQYFYANKTASLA